MDTYNKDCSVLLYWGRCSVKVVLKAKQKTRTTVDVIIPSNIWLWIWAPTTRAPHTPVSVRCWIWVYWGVLNSLGVVSGTGCVTCVEMICIKCVWFSSLPLCDKLQDAWTLSLFVTGFSSLSLLFLFLLFSISTNTIRFPVMCSCFLFRPSHPSALLQSLL